MTASSDGLVIDDTRPSPRQRRRERLRRELTDAALRLFAERGFNNVSVEEIADAADISRSTFFRYFASKEEVAIGKDSDRIAEVRDLIDALPSHLTAVAAAREIARYLAGRVDEEQDQVIAVDKMVADAPQLSARSADTGKVWERLVTEMAARKLASAPDDVVPPVIGVITIGALNSGVHAWRGSGYQADLPTLVEEAFNLLVRSIEHLPPLAPDAR